MKTFHHGGRIGDLVYALWTVKALGGGHLVVSDYHKPNWDLDIARSMQAFLEAQPYIQMVDLCTYGELPIVDYDLQKAEDDFNPEKFPEWHGRSWPGNCHLAKRYAVHFGLEFDGKPWLTANDIGDNDDVAMHVPLRRAIRNEDSWQYIIHALKEKECLKVAVLGQEPIRGLDVDFNYAATVIRSAKVFLGTVSSMNAIAEGLGKTRLLEQAEDCFNVSPTLCINQMTNGEVVAEVKRRCTQDHHKVLDKVKVCDFIKKGYKIRGIVHAGANDGYEVQWYKKLGIQNILCFEPGSAAIQRFEANYPDVHLMKIALGNMDAQCRLHITNDDGGSTFLPESATVRTEVVPIRRWTSLSGINRQDYNCCVIDVQGMELDVLRGMDDYIQDFDFFIVECSSKPIYKGEAHASEVVNYMNLMGFDQITPIQIHNDILFIKHRVNTETKPIKKAIERPSGNKINAGSGQRPFKQSDGWINIDINPRWNPDVVGDWNDLTMFKDNSMEMVISHHSLEHVGCGDGDGFLREAYRVLKPSGSLLIFIPDIKALAQRWLLGQISDWTYIINLMGAYMGDEADRHRWLYTFESLRDTLLKNGNWSSIGRFKWIDIAGANLAKDWWILAVEAKK